MRSRCIQQRDQEKIATSKADAGACAANSPNVAWRSTTRPSSCRGKCCFARVIAGANGSTAVTLFRPRGIAPRQATVAAPDLKDPGPFKGHEVEQCANLVFLRINLDRHLLSSPSIRSRAAVSSLLATGPFSAEDRDMPRGADLMRDVRCETVVAGDPLDRIAETEKRPHRLSPAGASHHCHSDEPSPRGWRADSRGRTAVWRARPRVRQAVPSPDGR